MAHIQGVHVNLRITRFTVGGEYFRNVRKWETPGLSKHGKDTSLANGF